MHRQYQIAALAPLLVLAACSSGGGGGLSVASASSTDTSTGTSTSTSTSTGNGTSTGSGTSTGGSLGGTSTGTGTSDTTTTNVTASQANMFDVSATTSFDAVGALQSFQIKADGGTLYQGNASTVATPSGTISYSPRDGIFTLALQDSAAGVTRNVTFQDPNHRATADTARADNYQVPLLPGFNYLQALDGDANLTFFYKRPVTGTFVTIGGYERTEIATDGSVSSEQGTFAFGDKSPTLAVPTSGTGHFAGDFLASMVGQRNNSALVLQWINGTSSVDADFGKRTLTLGLAGTVGPGYIKNVLVPDTSVSVPSGSAFAAQGTASWSKDNVAFSGKVASASFTVGGQQVAVDLTPVSAGTASGGASSIDGTFYGPKAQNVGGNVRIVGGTPDQRVDIVGAFTGVKQ